MSFCCWECVARRWGPQSLPTVPSPFLLPSRLCPYLMAFEPNRTGVLTVRLLSVMAGRWCCQPGCCLGRTPRSAGGLLAAEHAVGRACAVSPGWSLAGPCVVKKQAPGNCRAFGGSRFSDWRPGLVSLAGFCPSDAESSRESSLSNCLHTRGSWADGRRGVWCERPRCGLSKFLALEQFPCVT